MDGSVHRLRFGAAEGVAINVGDLRSDLADWLQIGQERWPRRYRDDFAVPQPVPVQCVYIDLPHTSILVDAAIHDVAPDSPFAIPGYEPPPGLLPRLAEMGVDPSAIDHVVITHRHLDHYNGVTIPEDGAYRPAFPNARHYIGGGDWTPSEQQTAREAPGSVDGRTLGVLQARGLLEAVDDRREIAPGVYIVPAPGETPGHLILRVDSQGQCLFCLGDLYHHPVEVEHPGWSVHWVDAQANMTSRRTLLAEAPLTTSWFVATHIPGFGRIEAGETGPIWIAAP